MAVISNVSFDNSGDGPLKVAGFNGVDFVYAKANREYFCGRYDLGYGWTQSPRPTAREAVMVQLMSKLVDKPEWQAKIFDEATVTEWREALQLQLISEKSWDWCVMELRDKAKTFKETGYLQVMDIGSCVCRTDNTVPASLKEELKQATPMLLAQHKAEWKADETGPLLQLVDPSMYMLRFGHSHVLDQGGRVNLSNMFDLRLGARKISRLQLHHKFDDQWLPCEVSFDNDSQASRPSVHITSYINNLDPSRFRSVYRTIEKLIGCVIEPWNKVLIKGCLKRVNGEVQYDRIKTYNGRVPMRIRTFNADYVPPPPVEIYSELPDSLVNVEDWGDDMLLNMEPDRYIIDLYEPSDFMKQLDAQRSTKEHLAKVFPAVEQYLLLPEPDSPCPMSLPPNWRDNPVRHLLDKSRRICRLQHPEPGTAFSYEDWKAGKTGKNVKEPRSFQGRDCNSNGLRTLPQGDHDFYSISLLDSFQNKGLQIVVNLASVELSPERPVLRRSQWQHDGRHNDEIVATAIYCYDLSNISGAALSFRQYTGMAEDWYAAAYMDYGKIIELFGLENRLPVTNPPSPNANIELDAPIWQLLGSAEITEGRLLSWSNGIEHRFEAFELTDKTRSGHCRYVKLSLVDPHLRVCSTRNVPPQCKDWAARQAVMAAKLPVPPEIQNMVIPLVAADLDGLWDVETAKKIKRNREKELRKINRRDRRFLWSVEEYGHSQQYVTDSEEE